MGKIDPRERRWNVREKELMIHEFTRAGSFEKVTQGAGGTPAFHLTKKGYEEGFPSIIERLAGALCEDVRGLIREVLLVATILAHAVGQPFPTPLWEEAIRREHFVPKRGPECYPTLENMPEVIRVATGTCTGAVRGEAKRHALVLGLEVAAPAWEGVTSAINVVDDLLQKNAAWHVIEVALNDLYLALVPLANVESTCKRLEHVRSRSDLVLRALLHASLPFTSNIIVNFGFYKPCDKFIVD